jgi:hypothetical protein
MRSLPNIGVLVQRTHVLQLVLPVILAALILGFLLNPIGKAEGCSTGTVKPPASPCRIVLPKVITWSGELWTLKTS